MRVTRGLFQSFGASGSLLAAAACALFAISAAVGFRGWPGLDAGSGGAPDLVVSAAKHPKPRAQRAGRPSGEFAPSATPPRRVLAAAEPPSQPRPTAPASVPVTKPALAAPAAAPAPATPAPSATSAPSAPARSLAAPVAQTVRDTGQGTAATIVPVSPAAAQTVTTATDTVAGVVEKTGSLLAP